MKILLVNDYATPTGGAELGTLMLRDGLRRRGHEARIFSSTARPGREDSFADYECFGTTSRCRTLLQTANLSAYRRLRSTLAEFRPDVVHVRMFLTQLSPLILPLLRDVPSVCHIVWSRAICPVGTKVLPDDTPCQSPWGTACYRHGCLPLRDWLPLMAQMNLWRRWRPVFDRVVANSHALKQALLDEGIGPVDVIWNGVPVQPPRPPLTRPPTVAFAGRLVRQKGCDFLVQAFATVAKDNPAVRLVIAGDGPERGALEKLVNRLGLSSHVVLTGHLPRAVLEETLAPAWVQTVPSRFSEGFGNVAAEAMMRGTAVVASACGGLIEVVHDGQTGFLVPPGDPAALVEAIARLLQNRELAETMGRAGRAVALAQLSEDAFINRFLGVYESVA